MAGNSTYPNEIYAYERGTTVYTGRPTKWAGKLALPYLSDYGYAADLGKCTKQLISYSDSTCASNNWMYSIIAPDYGWLLLTLYNSPNTAWNITPSNQIVSGHDGTTYSANGVTPVLYLNPELSIKSGTGTSSSPYQLSV